MTNYIGSLFSDWCEGVEKRKKMNKIVEEKKYFSLCDDKLLYN